MLMAIWPLNRLEQRDHAPHQTRYTEGPEKVFQAIQQAMHAASLLSMHGMECPSSMPFISRGRLVSLG